MSPETTVLKASLTPLPTVEPHLMPFHIQHDGSAPLSTYFIVKPEHANSDVVEGASTVARRLKARFCSSFRGRKMKGLTVDLPEGYIGVIVAPEDDGKEVKRPRESPVKKGRKGNRRSTRRKAGEDEDDDMHNTDIPEEEPDAASIKTLTLSGKFTSFTLWNADADVDEGRDEYLRSLSEYQCLMAEARSVVYSSV
ncbi:ribonuclease H2, subunit C [Hysterangium stoloniferum]|nr:ribonuclease H2, subunit C [Hysterangium stoloniferum]